MGSYTISYKVKHIHYTEESANGFKYFVEKYDPSSIISYNSLNISTGNTDLAQGFKIINRSKPQAVWVNTKKNSNPATIRDSSLRTLRNK
jgi:hypothetical protein